jgi:hypothetical protein
MAETTPPPPTGGPDAPMDDRIEDLHIEQELQDSYLTYAMSTIMDRACPTSATGSSRRSAASSSR